MATLATQTISTAGTAPTYGAAAAADKFTPSDTTFLHVKNTNAATRDVTIDSKVTSNYGTDVNLVVTVPATTGDMLIGPLPAQRFAGTDGLGDITYSAIAGVTIAVIRL